MGGREATSNEEVRYLDEDERQGGNCLQRGKGEEGRKASKQGVRGRRGGRGGEGAGMAACTEHNYTPGMM